MRGGIAQEPLDLGRVARRHLREDGLALALGQVLEEERDLVGGQPVELGAELLRARRGGGSSAQRLALELREHRRALLGRQRLEEHDPVLAREIVEQLREVGRVDVRDRRRRAPAGFSRISSSMSGPMTLARDIAGYCVIGGSRRIATSRKSGAPRRRDSRRRRVHPVARAVRVELLLPDRHGRLDAVDRRAAGGERLGAVRGGRGDRRPRRRRPRAVPTRCFMRTSRPETRGRAPSSDPPHLGLGHRAVRLVLDRRRRRVPRSRRARRRRRGTARRRRSGLRASSAASVDGESSVRYIGALVEPAQPPATGAGTPPRRRRGGPCRGPTYSRLTAAGGIGGKRREERHLADERRPELADPGRLRRPRRSSSSRPVGLPEGREMEEVDRARRQSIAVGRQARS